jgi:hypothetical protein
VGLGQFIPDTIRDMAYELLKSIAIILGLIGLGAFFVAAEIAKWSPVLKAAGVYAD